MLANAFWFAVVTWVVCVALCIPFVEAVKEEAPATYAAWGEPGAFGIVWNYRVWWPFSGMLLSRQYRTALASCPRSRAWASWLYLAHWFQLAGLAALVVSILLGWHQ